MRQTFQPHGLEFEIIAGSAAARAEAKNIVAEIQSPNRVETIALNNSDLQAQAAVVTPNRQAFDSSKGISIIGVDPRSQEKVKASGIYDLPNVSNKAEFGAHTSAIAASRIIPNVSSKATNTGISI